jgi:hypothetical protein
VGYAEFGGTGSVEWEVGYKKGNGSSVGHDEPHGQLRGQGTDKDSEAGEDEILTVVCTEAEVKEVVNGKVTIHVRLAKKKKQVTLSWGTSPHLSPETLSMT